MSDEDPVIEFGGTRIATDAQGYLRDRRQWSAELARQLAAADGIELGDAHYDVIQFLREYYERYELSPPMRLLVKALAERFGPERSGSLYLYRLFPDGPAKQASRYAGLPKPATCI